MSLSFKTKYEQLKDNAPLVNRPQTNEGANACAENYQQESNARNICFVWLDGKRIFLNYSYLVSGEYLPQDGIITLEFTTHKLTLKGVNLETLYYNIMQYITMQVICVDERYNLIDEAYNSSVNQIEISRL